MTTEFSFKPLKRNLWTDLEELFGPNGACAGCWCMFWKLRGKAYEEAKGYEARQMHKTIVDSGTPTGLLAYLHGEVVDDNRKLLTANGQAVPVQLVLSVFALTIATVQIVPVAAAALGWPAVTAALAAGPAVGVAVMTPLCRRARKA